MLGYIYLISPLEFLFSNIEFRYFSFQIGIECHNTRRYKMNSKYIKVFLRLINWIDKTTGEERSCYAWSSQMGGTASVLGEERNVSVSFYIAGARIANQSDSVTIWENDMTDEEFSIYKEMGNTIAYAKVDGNPGSPDCSTSIVSTKEHDELPQEHRAQLFA